jgi:hypothetical protein
MLQSFVIYLHIFFAIVIAVVIVNVLFSGFCLLILLKLFSSLQKQIYAYIILLCKNGALLLESTLFRLKQMDLDGIRILQYRCLTTGIFQFWVRAI